MVIGMRSQLGIAGPASLTGGTMSGRFPGPSPGPIQRPPSAQNAGGSSTSSNPAHRPGRGHPHQTPSSLHTPSQQRSSNPTSAQQAKLRADALSTTQAFFGRDGECLALWHVPPPPPIGPCVTVLPSAGAKTEKKLDGKASPATAEVPAGKDTSGREGMGSPATPSSASQTDLAK